jgi:hypothetical protein
MGTCVNNRHLLIFHYSIYVIERSLISLREPSGGGCHPQGGVATPAGRSPAWVLDYRLAFWRDSEAPKRLFFVLVASFSVLTRKPLRKHPYRSRRDSGAPGLWAHRATPDEAGPPIVRPVWRRNGRPVWRGNVRPVWRGLFSCYFELICVGSAGCSPRCERSQLGGKLCLRVR